MTNEGELIRLVAVILLAGLLLPACTSIRELDDPPTQAVGPTPSSTPSTSGRSALAERAFFDREQLPFCGSVELLSPWAGSSEARAEAKAKVDCLTTANRTVGAELLVAYLTPEGDPIRHYYRKEPGTYGYHVFTDNTEDRFGVRRWGRHQCDGVGFSSGEMHCSVE